MHRERGFRAAAVEVAEGPWAGRCRVCTLVHDEALLRGVVHTPEPVARLRGSSLPSAWSTGVYRTILRSHGLPQLPSVDRMVDLDRTRPVWRQIAAVLEQRITDGTYPAGSRVPSVVELSAEFEVAASTAQKVLAHLKAEGLVRAEVGLGTFVADRPPT